MSEKMTDGQVEIVCNLLHYIPTRNVVGLRNGTACFLFDNWTPNSVCAHSFIGYPGDLTRGFLRDTFRYIFSNVDWLIGVTPGDNEKALAFNRRIGFAVRDRLPSGFAKGVDTVYQVLHHSTCKYWRRPERQFTTYPTRLRRSAPSSAHAARLSTSVTRAGSATSVSAC